MLERIKNYNNIPFIISLAFFMEAMDSSVLNTAIPAMSRSLHVNPVDLKVALISYLLSLAVFIPISGWIADKYGEKKVFISALFIFTGSSLWCGFSHSLTGLVIARFIQGLGGALSLPVGRLIIIRQYGRQNLIRVMNRVVTMGALGIMLGPAIGGVITQYFSWHWIFWINIPVGLIAIFLTYLWLENKAPGPIHPLDKIGFVLFGLALASFTFGLSMFSQTTMSSSMAWMVIIFSLCLFAGYGIHSRTQPFPIVKTSLFQFRTFRLSVAGNLFSRLGFSGIPFVVPLLLQIGFGFSADKAGLLLSPIAIGIVLSKSLSIFLLRLFGYKRLLIANSCLTGGSIWLFTLMTAHTSLYLMGMLTFVYGFIVALQYSLMNSLAYAEISEDHLSAASSITSTIQQLSQSFGVAVCALFIHLFLPLYSKNMVLNVPVIQATLFAIGLLTILSSLLFFRLKSDDGHQMIL